MKISVKTADLLDHLQTIARVASARSAIQALAGVQIDASGAGIELRATDQELSIRVPLGGEVGQEGAVVLPARLLLDVIRQLPGDSVTLEYRGQEQDVEIVGGSARFHLRTLRNEDFPALPESAGSDAVSMPAAEFVATISRVARAASRDETRPILTGVLVSAEGEKLRMVATDSYRLSVKETPLPSKISDAFEANIPARALEELARLAGEETESISVSVRENQAVFMVGDVALSTRLIEGQFPNFQQLLPDEFEHELRIPTEELLATARRISLLAQKNAPLRLAFSEGELTISAQTPDVGEASEKMPVPFAGEPMEIGFNPEFLLSGLESAESDDVLLRLISPLRPGLIVSGDDSGFLYLIMPIRLNV
jgi:DNA polymerase III subunit beta